MFALVWNSLYMSAFVIAVGYGLHYYAFKRGIANEHDLVKTKELKRDADGNKREYKTGNRFLDKWLDFGGGYYGVMAFIKLMYIELGQIKEFIQEWPGLTEFINDLGLGTLISFLIEQFMNFIKALMWPIDYLGSYEIFQFAIFIAITWYAYEFSRKLARRKLNERDK